MELFKNIRKRTKNCFSGWNNFPGEAFEAKKKVKTRGERKKNQHNIF